MVCIEYVRALAVLCVTLCLQGDDKDLWAAYQERYVDTVRERDTAAADTEGQQAGNSSGSAGADKSESEAREKTV